MSLTCPRCRLALRPRSVHLAVDHCPRCMARDRLAVPMRREAADEVRLDGVSWRAPAGVLLPPGG